MLRVLHALVFALVASLGIASGANALGSESALGENFESASDRVGALALEACGTRQQTASHATKLTSGSIHAARGAPALAESIAKTFAGGKYASRVLQRDVVAYRYSGGVSGVQGRFLTTSQTVRQIGSPAAAQRALNLPAGATAEQLNALVIPKGTTIFYGRVAGGGETATQIFIQDSSVLRAVP
jgi:hypothetical protein